LTDGGLGSFSAGSEQQEWCENYGSVHVHPLSESRATPGFRSVHPALAVRLQVGTSAALRGPPDGRGPRGFDHSRTAPATKRRRARARAGTHPARIRGNIGPALVGPCVGRAGKADVPCTPAVPCACFRRPCARAPLVVAAANLFDQPGAVYGLNICQGPGRPDQPDGHAVCE
jgi:hypothetical protein